MKQFEIGKTYYGRFIGDYNLIEKIIIIKRTNKSVWFYANMEKRIIRKKIYLWHDKSTEYIMPHGQYSMAMIIIAEHEYKKEF